MFRFNIPLRQQHQQATTQPKVLAALLRVVSEKKVSLKPDDIFKLCVTANGRDGKQLGLMENKQFVSSLRDAASANVSSFSPFQMNQVKEMCTKAGLEFSAVAAASAADNNNNNNASAWNSSTANTTTTSSASSPSSTGKTVGEKLWDTSNATTTTNTTSSPFSPPSSDVATTNSNKQQQQQPYQIDETTDPKSLQDIMDVLFVAKKTFDERNTYDLRKVQSVCNPGESSSSSSSNDRNQQQQDLMTLIPWLTAKPLLYIIKTLAHINHQDYTLAQKLSRRVCELTSTLTTGQCTRVLGQLYRLKVQDSLTVIVRKIENEPNHLSLSDLVGIIQAAHAQTHVSAALQPLVGRSLFELSGRIGETHMSIYQLVQCVEVAAKFGQASNPHVKLIVDGAGRRASEMNDRLLATTLQNAHAMKLISAEVFAQLHNRAVQLVPNDQGMDVRFLEPLLDVFSLLPFNSAPFMDAMLLRLSDDAGKLHVNNLVSVIELVASYPGARGSTAVPALALAASMRKEVFDQQSLINIVLSLAQLNQLSDEFFDMFEFLCSDQRKGFKHGSELVELLSFLSGDGGDTNGSSQNAAWRKSSDFAARFVPLFIRAASDLIPSMSQEETLEMQRQLGYLGIEDRGLNRRLISRLESLNVERAEAERAANLAAMRRMNNPQHSHHFSVNQQQQNAEMEWDAVPTTTARQPQGNQHQQRPNVNMSGWGDASNVSSSRPSQQQQQHQQQYKNQRPPHNQNQHQQQQFHRGHQNQQNPRQPQNQNQQANRRMSSRELAALSKQKQQHQQRGQPPKQQQKKPFDLKKAQWDMDI